MEMVPGLALQLSFHLNAWYYRKKHDYPIAQKRKKELSLKSYVTDGRRPLPIVFTGMGLNPKANSPFKRQFS